MRTNVVVLPDDATLEQAYGSIRSKNNPKGSASSVLDTGERLTGVVTRNQLLDLYDAARAGSIRLANRHAAARGGLCR